MARRKFPIRAAVFILIWLTALAIFISYHLNMDVKVTVNFGQPPINPKRPKSDQVPMPDHSDDFRSTTPANISSRIEIACKFPQLLIDDPLIKPYLRTYGPLECSKEKNWVYTNRGKFYISPEAVKKHGNILCKYWRYDRISDYYFYEVNQGPYMNGTPVNGDAFYAQCNGTDNSTYENLHMTVPVPNPESDFAFRLKSLKHSKSTNGLNTNVLIYLLDSVSRINFIRKLPNFYNSLSRKMNAYVMEGFNIVGDGTPWAVIPMLTGHFQHELPEARRRLENASFVDQWPFLFKKYRKSGYVTSYGEEQPLFSAFSYKLNGFDRKPVDHYMRTFMLAVEKYKKKHKPFCLGDTPRSIVWLKFWRQLQQVYRPLGALHFSFLFSSDTSHDDYNVVQTLDEHWADEFESLYKEDYLNDTILIIMADHGRRFGPVRQTQSGKLEEKLPFLALVMPEWFERRYPLSQANLKINTNRLITAFDLHATLEHILNFQRDGGKGNVSERGISLFKEIPSERTCANAYIKAHFCSCLDWKEVRDLKNPIVSASAQTVINYFNKQLRDAPGKCANLSLGKIISARMLTPNEKLMAFKESTDIDNTVANLNDTKELHSVLYQIRFTTQPGDGDWEASLTYYIKQKNLGFSTEDISRLNSYNDQANCVMNTHHHLRTFCYCLK